MRMELKIWETGTSAADRAEECEELAQRARGVIGEQSRIHEEIMITEYHISLTSSIDSIIRGLITIEETWSEDTALGFRSGELRIGGS